MKQYKTKLIWDQKNFPTLFKIILIVVFFKILMKFGRNIMKMNPRDIVCS